MFESREDAIKEIPGVAYMRNIDGRNRIYFNPEKLSTIEKVLDEILVENSPFDRTWHYTEWDGQWKASPIECQDAMNGQKLISFQYHTSNPNKYDQTLCTSGKKDYFHPHVSNNKKLYNQISDVLWDKIEKNTDKISDIINESMSFNTNEIKLFEEVLRSRN